MPEMVRYDGACHGGDAESLFHGGEDAEQAGAGVHEAIGVLLGLQCLLHDRAIDTPLGVGDQGNRLVVAAGLVALLEDPLEALEPVDRKSTRLNSSHVRISYAVFCLKK